MGANHLEALKAYVGDVSLYIKLGLIYSKNKGWLRGLTIADNANSLAVGVVKFALVAKGLKIKDKGNGVWIIRSLSSPGRKRHGNKAVKKVKRDLKHSN